MTHGGGHFSDRYALLSRVVGFAASPALTGGEPSALAIDRMRRCLAVECLAAPLATCDLPWLRRENALGAVASVVDSLRGSEAEVEWAEGTGLAVLRRLHATALSVPSPGKWATDAVLHRLRRPCSAEARVGQLQLLAFAMPDALNRPPTQQLCDAATRALLPLLRDPHLSSDAELLALRLLGRVMPATSVYGPEQTQALLHRCAQRIWPVPAAAAAGEAAEVAGAAGATAGEAPLSGDAPSAARPARSLFPWRWGEPARQLCQMCVRGVAVECVVTDGAATLCAVSLSLPTAMLAAAGQLTAHVLADKGVKLVKHPVLEQATVDSSPPASVLTGANPFASASGGFHLAGGSDRGPDGAPLWSVAPQPVALAAPAAPSVPSEGGSARAVKVALPKCKRSLYAEIAALHSDSARFAHDGGHFSR